MARSAKQIASQLKAAKVSAKVRSAKRIDRMAKDQTAMLKSKKIELDAKYKAMGRAGAEAHYRKKFKVPKGATIDFNIGPFRGPFKPKG